MAIEHNSMTCANGVYQIFTLAAGDTLILTANFYVDFQGRGLSIHTKPASGGSVVVTYSVAPTAAANTFRAHEMGTVTSDRGYLQQAPINALKFVAATAAATIEILSASGVDHEEVA